MTKATLKLGAALLLAAAVAAALAPAVLAAAQAEEGDSNLLTVVFATLGASFGAAALVSLGYLLRRRLGLDWQRSQGAANAAGEHHQEAPAAVPHGEAGEGEQERGGGHP